jgi:integrase
MPMFDRSRRTITLPAALIELLRAHRGDQAAWRLQNGMGKDPLDLVFPDWDGTIRDPRRFSKQFSAEVQAAGLPHATFHGLRHTHITELLRRGVPVHIVSARAGHANPTVTLNTYAHVLPGDQEGLASGIDATLRAALEE